MRLLLLICVMCFGTICFAEIYEQIDKSGRTTYTDIPISGSKKVDIKKGNVTRTPLQQPNVTTQATVTTGKSTIPYTKFIITSPVDQQTLQNQREIPVEIGIEPELQKGDTIRIVLDGKAVGDSLASTHLKIDNAERGTHQIYAELLDANQAVIKQSNSITIYIHYASTNSPARQ